MWRAVMILCLMAMSLVGGAASASDWLYEEGEDDPFKGGRQRVAITFAANGFMFGFRCTKAADIAMLAVSPEEAKPEHGPQISRARFNIMVIVDDDAKRVLPANVDVTLTGNNYRWTAELSDVASVLSRVASAKRRVAVGVEFIGGSLVWSEVFSVAGSRRTLQPMIDACGNPSKS